MLAPTLNATSLAAFLDIVQNRDVNAETATVIFIALMKRREIHSSRQVSIATARLCLKYIALSPDTKINQVRKLIDGLKRLGKRLMTAQPREIVLGNIVRRVLGVVRDEVDTIDQSRIVQLASAAGILTEEDKEEIRGSRPNLNITYGRQTSYFHPQDVQETNQEFIVKKLAQLNIPFSSRALPRTVSTLLPPHFAQTGVQRSMFSLLAEPIEEAKLVLPPVPEAENKDLRGEFINGVKEIIEELVQVDEQIAQHSEDFIHPGEFILVHGPSLTVQRFLLHAAKKRKFTVVVIESFPNDHINAHHLLNPCEIETSNKFATSEFEHPMPLHDLKKTLASYGVDTILFSDAAVFAIMSRINKVILGTHAIMSNGSLVATAGARTIAITAKEFSIPVIVVSGIYKLTPSYPFVEKKLLEIGGAAKVIGWDEGHIVDKVDVINPVMDFVPAGMIDLFITNAGGHSPSYLYKLVEENYNAADLDEYDLGHKR